MKTKYAIALVLSGLVWGNSGSVCAGPFSKLGGLKKAASEEKKPADEEGSDAKETAKEAVATAQEAYAADYVGATAEFAASLEKAGEALGVKDEVLEKIAPLKALSEGTIDNKVLKKNRKASEEAVEIIEQGMKEAKMDDTSKALMKESMGHQVNGLVMETELGVTVAQYMKDARKNAGLSMGALKSASSAGTAMVLAKNIPDDLILSKKTLGIYAKFAKLHGIKVPKNATKFLPGE